MFFATLMALPAVQDAPMPVSLEIGFDGAQCTVVSDDAQFGVDELRERAGAWAADDRAVQIRETPELPEDCVTAAVFALQQAGIARVEQVREPDPLGLEVLAGTPCRLTVNGSPLAMEDLPALASASEAGGVKVRLRAAPDAPYQCLDQVVAVLKQHDLIAHVGLVMAPARGD